MSLREAGCLLESVWGWCVWGMLGEENDRSARSMFWKMDFQEQGMIAS